MSVYRTIGPLVFIYRVRIEIILLNCELLLARLHEVHRAIVVTSVVSVYVYVYVRVTLSVKVFKIVIS